MKAIVIPAGSASVFWALSVNELDDDDDGCFQLNY